jgi:CRISPR-associated protein (TIGR02710 family)
MIISVGGTPEPVVFSILRHRPEFVCFFASQQSIETIAAVKNVTRDQGFSFSDYKVMADDPEDLTHCYEKALECVSRLHEKCAETEDVFVDYTGGTKTMSAALAIATVGHGYNFSYVGGSKRNKNETGTVETGFEVLKTGVSPWHLFAVEEKKRIALFVANYQYEAAIATMQQTIDRLREGERRVWQGLIQILSAYLAWDNFDHTAAMRHFGMGLKQLEVCSAFVIDRVVVRYVEAVKPNCSTLDDMSRKTNGFKDFQPVMVRDLISNARRRYLQNKYDDGIARLYRALEMAGQIAFREATGCATSDVAPGVIPETIREAYVRKYRSTVDNKIRLPLQAAFEVSKEIGHPAGIVFSENYSSIRKLLNSRNESILAHGASPIKRDTYEKFEKIILDLYVQEELIEFPMLEW